MGEEGNIIELFSVEYNVRFCSCRLYFIGPYEKFAATKKGHGACITKVDNPNGTKILYIRARAQCCAIANTSLCNETHALIYRQNGDQNTAHQKEYCSFKMGTK